MRQPATQPGLVRRRRWSSANSNGPRRISPRRSEGQLPMGKPTDEWTYGDVDAGFKNAALVLDETFVTPNTSHQTLETRSAMAYWQNGKLYMHCSTQSTVQTVAAVARWVGIRPGQRRHHQRVHRRRLRQQESRANLVVDSGAAVEEGQRAGHDAHLARGGALHRPRPPGVAGRVKMGFAKDGRVTAIDLFVICDNGPYESQGDARDQRAGSRRCCTSRRRCASARVSVLTNTPPRVSQRSPGGMQGIAVIEPMLAKAARKLGIDQVTIHRINAPEGKAPFGPPGPRRHGGMTYSAFLKEALDKGAELFNWDERKAQSGKRVGYEGARRRRRDEHVLRRLDRLRRSVRHQARRPVYDPVGHRQPRHRVGDRRPPRRRRDRSACRGRRCEITWGNTAQAPAVDLHLGRQPDDARDDARGARGGHGCEEEAAGDRRARRSAAARRRIRWRTSACPSGGRSMTLAQAAQKAIELGGKYDGHELPEDINAFTKRRRRRSPARA